MTRRAVITVVNSFSPMSMEFHEFVLYRARRFPDEEHHLLVLGPADADFTEEARATGADSGVEVVECGGRYSDFRRHLSRMIRQCRAAGVPALVHGHMGRSGAAALVLNLLPLRGVPSLYTVHTMFSRCSLPTRLPPVLNFLLASVTVFVSQSACDAFPAALRGLRRGRGRVIVNGVDMEWVDAVLASGGTDEDAPPVERPFSIDRPLRLLNVGRVIPAKNQSWLVRLMTALPETVHLTIIGSGPLDAELEAQVRELNLHERVRLAGMMPRREVFQEFRKADLFVSSSVREGLPIAVLEAMSARMPVILSDIGPHTEIGRHDDRIPVLPLETGAWTQAIRTVMEMPATSRADVGKQNRCLVEQHFSLARMHDEYSRLYAELWERAARRLR